MLPAPRGPGLPVVIYLLSAFSRFPVLPGSAWELVVQSH
jgi:hypothetical protein